MVSHDRYFLERGHRLGLGAARRRPDLDAARAASTSTSSAGPRPSTRRPALLVTSNAGSASSRAQTSRRPQARPGERGGARGAQGAGPDRPAARAGRRARAGRSTRRSSRPARTTSGSPSSAPSSTRWPASGTPSSWSGSRSPRRSSNGYPARGPPNGCQQPAQQPGQLLLLGRRQLGQQRLLGLDERGERAVHRGFALAGQPDDHPAPVVGVRLALDEAAVGQPVDAVGHGAAGDQGGAQQPARRELVRRRPRGAAPRARRTPTARCRAP